MTTWTGTLTAISSISHGGETRGTTTMLRRETILTAEGPALVPIISGNALRGRLRRVGEELLRDQLHYEGLLSPAVAHALRGGGALAKTGREPLTGARLHTLRTLVPHLAVFGAAGGGTIIGGSLDVGKVVPHVAETNHITKAQATTSAFEATQLETYTRQNDELTDPGFTTLTTLTDHDDTPGTQQMLYRVETFPAGTTFTTWLHLRRPTELTASFFTDVLTTYTTNARIGGRLGIGHGHLHVNLTPNDPPADPTTWRTTVATNRDQILTALGELA